MSARAMAPLGPPPLCTVPRGWDRIPEALTYDSDPEAYKKAVHDRIDAHPLNDWGFLDAMVALAEQGLGRRPATWGEAAEGCSGMFGEEHIRRVRKCGFWTQKFTSVGLSPDTPLPDHGSLQELGTLCRHWRNGTGPFADGCEYELPLAMQIWEGYRPELRAKFMAIYEDAGAPWGRTEVAAALYLEHAGEESIRRTAKPCRRDGERFVTRGGGR